MANRVKRTWGRARLALGVWGLGIAVLVAGLVLAYQFVGPAPPRHVVLATGADGGAYQLYGERVAAYLRGQGISVEMQATAGAVENLSLLGSDSGVDIAFVQSGLIEGAEIQGVTALGSMYLEPIWLFVRADLDVEFAPDLVGRRIVIGSPGSGTRAVVARLLAASGQSAPAGTVFDIAPDDLPSSFESGEIDAAFVIAGAESQQVTALVGLENINLMGMPRADAYARHASYLTKIVLPEGILSLRDNLPDRDVETVAVTAMLAVREDFHPALIDLLMMGANDVFGEHTLLSDAGEFPSPLNSDLPLSKEAQRYFERGAPFLMRYLPFWAATLVDRLWVLLFPMIGLLIPLFKLLPPLYHWRIRRRLLQRYAALRDIDPQRNELASEDDRSARMQLIEKLDNATVGLEVPKDYTDDVYKLRRDIDLVRRKLGTIAISPDAS